MVVILRILIQIIQCEIQIERKAIVIVVDLMIKQNSVKVIINGILCMIGGLARGKYSRKVIWLQIGQVRGAF